MTVDEAVTYRAVIVEEEECVSCGNETYELDEDSNEPLCFWCKRDLGIEA